LKSQKHFISKLTDSDSENSETQVWLEFAESCDYIPKKQKEILYNKSIEGGKLINFMINNPNKFGSN
jgi:four helix bundle protein